MKNINKRNYPKKHRDIETKRLLLLQDNLISLRREGLKEDTCGFKEEMINVIEVVSIRAQKRPG